MELQRNEIQEILDDQLPGWRLAAPDQMVDAVEPEVVADGPPTSVASLRAKYGGDDAPVEMGAPDDAVVVSVRPADAPDDRPSHNKTVVISVPDRMIISVQG